ncbi:MAG: hypothetical protein IPP46_09580 [Bacteroidetes bacterium]|nr:hypothetical protein [Bacteroidota bacterium]
MTLHSILLVRLSRTSIIDKFGDFWFHGGCNSSSVPYAISLNDLWTYDVSTNEWTFIWADQYYHRKQTFGQKALLLLVIILPEDGSWSFMVCSKSTCDISMFGGYQFYPPSCFKVQKYNVEIRN